MSEYLLTAEQRHAVDAAFDDNRSVIAISGPAGSGKTLVAMEIAKGLITQGSLFSGGQVFLLRIPTSSRIL